MGRTKYNVDESASNRTCDGIAFDSEVEMKFYADIVLPGIASGEIAAYELQKPYELQPGFRYRDKSVRPITYVADFYIEYADGRKEVIDIKGMPDSVAKVKRKLFWYRYPDIEYLWVSYSKKYGGWIEYDELVKLRAKAKREKAKKAREEL